jgi:hypothetical protein
MQYLDESSWLMMGGVEELVRERAGEREGEMRIEINTRKIGS